MSETNEQTDWSSWFSTYGLLTAERILERFNITLPHESLIKAIKDTNSVYNQLLRVPLRNVFNGIILQQAQDYQTYAQKLFVDYLLSGADAVDVESPGALTRDEIEKQRTLLTELADTFQKQVETHQLLIAESQNKLIDLTKNMGALLHDNSDKVASVVADYAEQADTNNARLRDFRHQFYDLILRVTELLTLLPDYKPDHEKETINRASLAFDSLIGEQ